MLDLGTSFVASVERDPGALAIVDGDIRLTYQQWYGKISSLIAAFDELGLKPGDHLLTVLQNCWQAATIHWACQLASIIVTPVNWRATGEEIDFCIGNAEARAIVYQDVSAPALAAAQQAKRLRRISVGIADSPALDFASLVAKESAAAKPRANAEDWSLMLYTSGTTARPKGVPRRHRAERAAAVAHVAQNLYARGERTLGVMPLYHTMGVRSLLAMSLVGGTFVCLPRFDAQRALTLIAAERISTLYLVPTLYHDLVHHPLFAEADVSSVRKLGFAGAPMTDALLKKLEAAFRPDLFVNHYGSSEIYTFTIEHNAPAKPGSAGRAGINQAIRVVPLGAARPRNARPSARRARSLR
jgi:2-furoate---CoA ligase